MKTNDKKRASKDEGASPLGWLMDPEDVYGLDYGEVVKVLEWLHREDMVRLVLHAKKKHDWAERRRMRYIA